MKRKHLKAAEEPSRASYRPPWPTGGATARYENNSHTALGVVPGIWYDQSASPANATDSTAIVATITDITQPIGEVTTAAAHGLSDNMRVVISGVVGMTEVNDTIFTVKGAAGTEFQLFTAPSDPAAAVPVDTSAYDPYISGGTASNGALTFPVFDGTSHITIGTPAKLDFDDFFTVSAWVFLDIVTPPIQANEYFIGRDLRGGAGRNVALSMADTNGMTSAFIWVPAGFKSAQSGTGFGGAWHFITFVNEGAGNDLRLYMDGALVTTTVEGGGAITWNAPTPWEFGRPQDRGATTDGSDYWQGKIDTARFYTRALSADEILRDYYAGKPAHP